MGLSHADQIGMPKTTNAQVHHCKSNISAVKKGSKRVSRISASVSILIPPSSPIAEAIISELVVAAVEVLLGIVVAAHLIFVIFKVVIDNFLLGIFVALEQVPLIQVCFRALILISVSGASLGGVILGFVFLVFESALRASGGPLGLVAVKRRVGSEIGLNGLPKLAGEESRFCN